MERARYKYMELTSEDPQAFGKQLTRALAELRSKGCEIVDVSMGLQTREGKPDAMLRVAQILILEPEKDTPKTTTNATRMN